MRRLRSLQADNPGPFTLEGTRTYVVGDRRVAVVDPGPADPEHEAAVAAALAGADEVTLVLTHGHADHVGAVEGLLDRRPDARVVGAGHPGARLLEDGQSVLTDAGALVVLHTPGHTRDHLCLHWPDEKALLAGDMVLGRGDTTWVAEYPGCVADYLASLDRLSGLELEVIHPAHGPDVADPAAALRRYREHRMARVEQVRQALEAVRREGGGTASTRNGRARGGTGGRQPISVHRSDPAGDPVPAPRDPEVVDAVLQAVYGGSIPTGLRRAARESVVALLEYVTGARR